MMLRTLLTAVVAAGLTLASLGPATAQTRASRIDLRLEPETAPADPFDWPRPHPFEQSVANRPRPELDPLGIPVGAFRFLPEIRIGAEVDDNVLKSENDRRADIAMVAAPTFLLATDAPDKEIRLLVDAEIYRYAAETSEDRENFGVEASGRFGLAAPVEIAAEAGYRRRHEARFSPDVGGAANPVRFDTASAAVSAARRFGAAGVAAQARVDRFDFADARDAATANNINNDDRDRTVWRLAGQAGYGRAEGLGGFVRLEGAVSDYDDAFDDNGFARDSEGLGFSIGAAADLTGVTTVQAQVGFRGQYYDDDGPARLNDAAVEALLLSFAINTNVTALTSVYANARRDVFETTLSFSPGGVVTRVEIGADHELLRNLLLSARLGGRMFDFDGIDREDYGVFFRFGAVYSIDRSFVLEAGFEHETVQSTGSEGGVDASVNRVMLRLAARP